MGTTENVMGGVIIVMIFMALVIYMNKTTTEYVIDDFKMVKQEHLMDLYSTNFNAFLLVTDPKTNKPISTLLADSIYFRKDTLNFSNTSVNVSVEFKEMLDEIYGEDRYYLEVKPKIVDVSLNFVIDGSSSLEPQRKKLSTELPSIIKKVQEKINESGDELVTADVFILEDKKQGYSLCNVFPENSYNHINEKSCNIIDADDIYNNLQNSTNNQSFDLNSIEYMKYSFNLTPPFSNETKINGMREGGIIDYYGSDWGTGTSYVSILRKDAAKLVVIFPMGDELSTSSISEDCFNIPMNNFHNRALQKVCDLCTGSCSPTLTTATEARSEKTVHTAAVVATSNGHIINPIFAYECDYKYKNVFNDQYYEIFSVNTTNVCKESNCNGCTLINEDVCFHPECKDDILSQMQYLATQTRGKVINLEDIKTLDYEIETTIKNNIDEYKFSVGTFRNESRYVVKRTLPLPNKMMVDVKLFVYPINDTRWGAEI